MRPHVVQPERTQLRMDRVAITASVVCLVHCLAMPLLILALPVLASSLFADESFHLFMLLWVLPASGLALWIGCRRHRDRLVLSLGITGLLILVIAGIWGESWFGEVGETGVTVLGSIAVVVAHARNYRIGRASVCGNQA